VIAAALMAGSSLVVAARSWGAHLRAGRAGTAEPPQAAPAAALYG